MIAIKSAVHCFIYLEILTAILVTLTGATGSPSVKRFSLDVSEVNITVNGIHNTITAYNGSYPGPEIRISPGDTVLINVTNSLKDQNTTVHWHGLSQRMTPYADGTISSQWPIAPGKWFEYEMKPTEDDIGTRFYHAHVGFQSINANGPLIVEDPKPPFEYDYDETMLISDYWHKTEKVMLEGIQNNNFTWIGTADVTMINGKGISSDLKGDPYILDVEYNKTYNLRFIGAQGLMYYKFSLFNHTFVLIEEDGTYVQPIGLDSLEIGAGQRLGTLLESKNEDQVDKDGLDGCYWMRFESRWRTPPAFGWAVVRYPGGCTNGLKVPVSNNTAAYLAPSVPPWVSGSLQPYSKNKEKTPPDDKSVTRRIVLWAQQVLALHSTTRPLWPINDLSYNETTLQSNDPYMIQLYKNETIRPSYDRAMSLPLKPFGSEDYFQQSWDPVSKTWTAKGGEVIDIVIVNNGSAINSKTEVHPWHFHSSKFWHMATGVGDFSMQAYHDVKASGAFQHPILKDTVTVFPGLDGTVPKNSSSGWVLLRYQVRPEQAGVWPLHCHIIPHLIQGMATDFALDPDTISTQLDLYRLADPNYFIFGQNVKSPFTIAQERGREESQINGDLSMRHFKGTFWASVSTCFAAVRTLSMMG
ncbi:unnamed protein product [Sympodiomycopsis kandeliae]